MRDVAFVPQRDVLQPHDAVCAHDPRHAAETFGKDGVALVRHRTGSLLTFLEFLLRLAYFGSLPMTNLQRELVERRSYHRERAEIFSVGIALNDLGGGGGRLQSESRANLLFKGGVEMRERADRATQIVHLH